MEHGSDAGTYVEHEEEFYRIARRFNPQITNGESFNPALNVPVRAVLVVMNNHVSCILIVVHMGLGQKNIVRGKWEQLSRFEVEDAVVDGNQVRVHGAGDSFGICAKAAELNGWQQRQRHVLRALAEPLR